MPDRPWVCHANRDEVWTDGWADKCRVWHCVMCNARGGQCWLNLKQLIIWERTRGDWRDRGGVFSFHNGLNYPRNVKKLTFPCTITIYKSFSLTSLHDVSQFSFEMSSGENSAGPWFNDINTSDWTSKFHYQGLSHKIVKTLFKLQWEHFLSRF